MRRMPQAGRLGCLLVIADHLADGTEAIMLLATMVSNVTKTLLEVTIPWFGLIENIGSNNGSHFISTPVKELTKSLGIKWE